MNNYLNLKQFNVTPYFYLFLTAHFFGWVLLPLLIRYNLPLDAIEGTIWGHQLEFGYDKDPMLNAWLTAFGIYISPSSGWPLYLFAQLCTITTLFIVWKLGKEILSPTYSLLAVLLLEGVQYFNFHAIDFNDNTLQLTFWALITYSFYKTLKQPSRKKWILTGIVAGIGMMAKYYILALLAAMAILIVVNRNYRQQFKSSGIYLGIMSFIAIITPHIIWLIKHNFITIYYVMDRAYNKPGWINHFYFPAEFLWQQLEVFIPSMMIFGLLLLGSKPGIAKESIARPSDRQFLLYAALGPMLLTCMMSLLFGIKLRAGWGMPLLTFWTILLFAYFPPRLSKAKIFAAVNGSFILLSALLSAYAISLSHSSTTSSANFPGKMIAEKVTKLWHQQYQSKLEYVAGSRWAGGNIAFYSKDKPAVFVEWKKEHALWIDDKKMRKAGAVFVWEISERETLPEEVKQNYPQLSKPIILSFKWHRDKRSKLENEVISIAFLPPESKGSPQSL